MNLSYEPVTLPRYQFEALTKRCAQLEMDSAMLEKVVGLSAGQLVQLLAAGFSLSVHSGAPVPRQMAISIAQLLPYYSLTLLGVAVLGEFVTQTRLHGPELNSFMRKALGFWRSERGRG